MLLLGGETIMAGLEFDANCLDGFLDTIHYRGRIKCYRHNISMKIIQS